MVLTSLLQKTMHVSGGFRCADSQSWMSSAGYTLSLHFSDTPTNMNHLQTAGPSVNHILGTIPLPENTGLAAGIEMYFFKNNAVCV